MNTLGHHQPTTPPTLATRILQILPAGVSVTSMTSLSYYHLQRMQGPVAPRSLLQHLYVSLYESIGFAPSLLFFLLVTVWSVLWFATGRLERPLGRLGRLAAMAVLLGVALNLGAGSVAPGPQKGELGAWLGSVLVGMVGYYPSLLLVWAATLGALLLATDFFFADSFERLWRARTAAEDEAGVEVGVTEHLRQLGSALRPTGAANTDEGVARPAEPLPSSASFAAAVAAAAAAAEAQERQSNESETVDEAYRGDEPSTSPRDASERTDEDRPLSYLERRRLREARRYARFEAADESEADASLRDPLAPSSFESSVVAPASSTPADQPTSSLPSADELPAAEPRFAEASFGATAFAESEPTDSSDAPWSDAPRSDDARQATSLSDVGPAMASEELPALTGASPVDDEVEVEEFELDENDESAGDSFEADDALEPSTGFAGSEPSPARSFEEAAAPWASEPPYVLPAASAQPPEPPERVEPLVAQQTEPPFAIPRGEPRPPVVDADSERAGGRQQNLFAQGLEEGLVQEAVDLVVAARRASAGFLQRKLRIDYPLALELLSELAARGVVMLEGDATQGRVVV